MHRILAGLFTSIALITSAMAADARLEDFAGEWIGKVNVESSGGGDSELRQSAVTITPDGQGGFSIVWTSIEEAVDRGEGKHENIRGGEVAFAPGKRPGLFAGTDARPDTEFPFQWIARIEGDALVVNGFRAMDGAKGELQTFRRTLSDGAMGLLFTRVVDGVVTRRASGTLSRFAN